MLEISSHMEFSWVSFFTNRTLELCLDPLSVKGEANSPPGDQPHQGKVLIPAGRGTF